MQRRLQDCLDGPIFCDHHNTSNAKNSRQVNNVIEKNKTILCLVITSPLQLHVIQLKTSTLKQVQFFFSNGQSIEWCGRILVIILLTFLQLNKTSPQMKDARTADVERFSCDTDIFAEHPGTATTNTNPVDEEGAGPGVPAELLGVPLVDFDLPGNEVNEFVFILGGRRH